MTERPACRRRLVAVTIAGLLLPAAAAPYRKEEANRTELSHPCSRAVSRYTRKLIEKEVLKPAQRGGVETWPVGCPFDPALDLYGHQEKQKQRKRPAGSGTTWTCGLCGKTFKSEHYLDLHLERMHMKDTPAGGVCPGDYCEMFDVCHGESRARRRKDEENKCDEVMLLKMRRRCEDAIFRCFPLSKDNSRKLHAQFSRHFCQVLDCRIREERRKEHADALMPVVVLLILIILVGFIVFSITVCCVDYSDDIVTFLMQSRLASLGFVKSFIKSREQARKVVGMDRTKSI